ncbi:MAG: hypothetical protein PUD72_03160 [Oscillospiraceae bacterium]|nr:hypothetical protein [Oscillospiraceae bacterium]
MLGKLFKHEFLTIGKFALPSYIVVLILALVGRFLTWITSRQYVIDNVPSTFVKILSILTSLITLLYTLVFLGIFLLTMAFLVYRFYKNFFTDEGYLMMTLPVKTPSLILSKLSNAWIWIIFSGIVAIVSLIITVGHFDELTDTLNNTWDSIKSMLEREEDFIKDELGVPIWVFVIELLVLGLAYLTRFILSWYASVSFGNLIAKKHKIIGTLFSYFLLFIITTIILSLYLTVITTLIPDYYDKLNDSSGRALQTVVFGSIAIYSVFSAGLFAFTNYIMKHKLNLD